MADDSGRLRPANSRVAERTIDKLLRDLSDLDLATPDATGGRRYRSSRPWHFTGGDAWSWAGEARGDGPMSLGYWLRTRVGKTLPAGCYLARVKNRDSIDDLDLDVEYVVDRHLVLGILGVEYILE